MAAPPRSPSSPPPAQPTVLLPLKMDAFALSPTIANPIDGHPSLIAPITQPNYTFLRLTTDVLQPDIVPFTDLHTAGVAGRNPRVFDLGTTKPRNNRIGVYLTWLIPRVYRAGTASTNSPPPPPPPKAGDPPPAPRVDNSAPSFIPPPVRWLVVRMITDEKSITPPSAQGKLPLLQAWVIESDRKRLIDDLDDSVDLQTDVSPFIDPGSDTGDPNVIETQAEVFIGYRADASGWSEDISAARVPICLTNSSNPLFADFQPHNGNVFSMCDGFEYTDADGKQKAAGATASYYVLGWHSDPEADLFYVDPKTKMPPNHAAVLAALNMTFPPAMMGTPDVQAFMEGDNAAGTRLLCHGAIYDVVWDDAARAATTPADDQGRLLQGDMPVAVGTTPLDALLAYVAAHRNDEKTPDDVKQLERDLYGLQALLLAQSDGVDDVRQAADELSAGNYVRTKTGTQYHFAVPGDKGDSTPPKVPTKEQIKDLRELNWNSYAYDMAAMSMEKKQWELFAKWWDYVGFVDEDKQKNKELYKTLAGDLSDDITALDAQKKGFQSAIEAAVQKFKLLQVDVKAAAAPPAFQTRDPTLIVGGIESGWPADYLDKLVVRLQSEIVTAPQPPQPDGWAAFKEMVASKMATAELKDTAKALLEEFLILHGVDVPPLPVNECYPLFHDTGPGPAPAPSSTAPSPPPGPWRDRWSATQPWFPLFLEWEVEYTHIPYEAWALEEITRSGAAHPQLRWAISDDYSPLYDYKKNTKVNPSGAELDDRRTLSGRILILPQPNFSLQSKLIQLFDTTPDDILTPIISKTEQKNLLDSLWKLPFLSAPLSGLTDHLLTMVQGTHVKPLLRLPQGVPIPLAAAVDAAKDIGFTDAMMKQIEKNTDLTPYGSLVRFLGSKHCAFKPVTHGQMRFTKVNIIDRFGQAIYAIDPSAQTPPALYPAISDFYAPAMLPDGRANVVTKEAPGLCEYIQLPPAINQPAQLSSCFLKEDKVGKDWRPAAEWENPIWGWIVINYPDRGIQLFTQKGVFYTEVRLGGQSNVPAKQVPKWLPLPPGAGIERLDLLAAQMQSDQDWLAAFMGMISEALSKGPAAPTAYAEFLTAIVGKPLALTAMGWSLELTTDELTLQSTLNDIPPDRYLLADKADPERKTYKFPVKLGDANRSYDGLVGYFLPPASAPPNSLDFDLTQVHSFFAADGKAVIDIDKNPYPSFPPFWSDPAKTTDPADLTAKRTANMNVFGAIVDPFAPVHAYSSFLPPAAIALPPWTWQDAMQKMTAFFRVGPVLLTGDVPPWEVNKGYGLGPGYDLATATVVPGAGVGVPVGVADWTWLQPYVKGEGEGEGEGEGVEGFLPLGIAKTDARPRFEMGPYTAVEGYLQLKTPVVGGPKKAAAGG